MNLLILTAGTPKVTILELIEGMTLSGEIVLAEASPNIVSVSISKDIVIFEHAADGVADLIFEVPTLEYGIVAVPVKVISHTPVDVKGFFTDYEIAAESVRTEQEKENNKQEVEEPPVLTTFPVEEPPHN